MNIATFLTGTALPQSAGLIPLVPDAGADGFDALFASQSLPVAANPSTLAGKGKASPDAGDPVPVRAVTPYAIASEVQPTAQPLAKPILSAKLATEVAALTGMLDRSELAATVKQQPPTPGAPTAAPIVSQTPIAARAAAPATPPAGETLVKPSVARVVTTPPRTTAPVAVKPRALTGVPIGAKSPGASTSIAVTKAAVPLPMPISAKSIGDASRQPLVARAVPVPTPALRTLADVLPKSARMPEAPAPVVTPMSDSPAVEMTARAPAVAVAAMSTLPVLQNVSAPARGAPTPLVQQTVPAPVRTTSEIKVDVVPPGMAAPTRAPEAPRAISAARQLPLAAATTATKPTQLPVVQTIGAPAVPVEPKPVGEKIAIASAPQVTAQPQQTELLVPEPEGALTQAKQPFVVTAPQPRVSEEPQEELIAPDARVAVPDGLTPVAKAMPAMAPAEIVAADRPVVVDHPSRPAAKRDAGDRETTIAHGPAPQAAPDVPSAPPAVAVAALIIPDAIVPTPTVRDVSGPDSSRAAAPVVSNPPEAAPNPVVVAPALTQAAAAPAPDPVTRKATPDTPVEKPSLTEPVHAHAEAPPAPPPHAPAAMHRADPVVQAAPELAVTRHLDLVRGDAWLDTLARDIAATATETGRLKFVLSPETMGRLEVEVRREDAGVHVHMAARNEAAREVLTAAQPRIAEEIRAHGVRLAGTEVSAGFDGDRSNGTFRASPQIETALHVDNVQDEPTTTQSVADGRYA